MTVLLWVAESFSIAGVWLLHWIDAYSVACGVGCGFVLAFVLGATIPDAPECYSPPWDRSQGNYEETWTQQGWSWQEARQDDQVEELHHPREGW